MIIAFLLTLLVGSTFTRLSADNRFGGQIERKNDIPGSYLLVQGNSLLPTSSPFNGNPGIWEIYERYPQLAKVLDCLWWEESRNGTDMGPGDNGLAIGHFQIHIDKHPEVSYDCAMNFSCSLRFTAESINNGNQNWWSPIKNKDCLFP